MSHTASQCVACRSQHRGLAPGVPSSQGEGLTTSSEEKKPRRACGAAGALLSDLSARTVKEGVTCLSSSIATFAN
jgi:hypothetical protein